MIENGSTMKKRMSVAILLTALSLCAGEATSQEVARSFDELVRAGDVQHGDVVHVTDVGGRLVKGTVDNLTATTLMVTRSEGDSLSWFAGDVVRVEQDDGIVDGVLKGLLTGVGITLFAAIYGEYYVARAGLPALGACTAIGAAVDIRMRRVLYQRSRAAGVAIAPTLSAGRVGARVLVAW